MPITAPSEHTSTPSPDSMAAISTLANQAKTEATASASMAGEGHYQAQGNPNPPTNGALGKLDGLIKASPGAIKPAALPTQLGPWNTNYIAFNNGVPVGSTNCALTLNQNGAWSFHGHFHDSGATSYNGEITWMVATAKGIAFSFTQSGHMAGTFESGSRDWNFNASGTNPQIQANWADLCANYHWRWQAAVNLNLGSLFNSVEKVLSTAVGIALQVIKVV